MLLYTSELLLVRGERKSPACSKYSMARYVSRLAGIFNL